ncbi:site-specific integrase [Rhodococcus xishaensis]|uniref:Site-specific integrase n=1 Tax=Rhodococcus xishaensis TaxID=2487364 RepID=A0A438AWG6_9NOCA|nr:site-specific integrase [Rhodococcus xishaensis]RVW03036.1 site-specific integrase [Rhodococcus xishaensis]
MARPPMRIGTWGSITRVEVSAGHWYADCRVRDMDGVTRRARRYTPPGVADKKGAAAERELITHLTERVRVGASDEITTETTIAQLWVHYRAELVDLGRAPRTLQRYDEVASFIRDGLGGVRLREITTQRIDAFLRTIEGTRGPGNAKTTRSVLSGMLSSAVRLGAIQTNLTRDARATTTRHEKNEKVTLTPERLAQLLAEIRSSTIPCPGSGTNKYHTPTVAEYCAKADLADLVTMFAATGVRMSELLGMQWTGVDFHAQTITIDGKVVRVPGEGLQRMAGTADPKSRRRVLALPHFALTMLRARKMAMPPNEHDAIFPSRTGTLRDPDVINGQWRRVRNALGLYGVTGHTFRRTVASIIDEQKLSPRVAADQLGHARPSMTQDVYMARGRVRAEVASALDRAVSGGIGGE